MSDIEAMAIEARRGIRRATARGAGTLALVLAALGTVPFAGGRLGAQAPSVVMNESTGASTIGARRATARPDAQIDAAGERYAPAVRSCYREEGLKRDPTLSGRLRVTLTVLPEGGVRAPMVAASLVRGIGMQEVASCIARAAGAWRLEGGDFRPEQVVLSFHLQPQP